MGGWGASSTRVEQSSCCGIPQLDTLGWGWGGGGGAAAHITQKPKKADEKEEM